MSNMHDTYREEDLLHITKYIVYVNAVSSLKLIYDYGNWLYMASKLFRRPSV